MIGLSIQQLFSAPTSTEWWRFAWILAGICLFIGIGETIRLAFRWSAEFTRKLVHISVAILIFFAPRLFERALPPLILALLFTIVAFTAIELGLLKSLHSVSRGAYGTVYYPLAFLMLLLVFWNSHPEIVSLSMLVLGLGDASAAIVGESIKNPKVYHLTADKKSIQGSTAMFVVTILGLLAGMTYFDGGRYSSQIVVVAVVCSALVATAWEGLSSRALDNITIPLSVAFVLYYVLVPTTMQDVSRFAVGTGLGVAIAIVAFYARFLTASGAVATFLLASLVFGVGGWKWTLPILVFFVLSSLLSRWGKNRKTEFAGVFEKTGTRDHGQVAANGGIGAILVLLQYVFQSADFYPLYVGAMAAVTADTWGTEIGTYFKGRTISIVSMRKVQPGTNGGVSLAGFTGGLIGSAIVVLICFSWLTTKIAFIAIIAGIVGSAADSIFGGSIQARYLCKRCGKSTERRIHCGEPTSMEGGVKWINNDFVNWICGLCGALTVLVAL
jgi:uncharacterized protein (TIGR00297 family)